MSGIAPLMPMAVCADSVLERITLDGLDERVAPACRPGRITHHQVGLLQARQLVRVNKRLKLGLFGKKDNK
jgi:hypothetical protein